MRKITIFLMLLVFVVSFMSFSDSAVLAARNKKETKESEAKAPESKLVCKFRNKEDMAEFEQLYISKQATFGRMGVLQAYFAMEQNNLAEIDKKMEEEFGFKMDADKTYDLDREAMEIRELPPVVQPPTE